MKHTARQLGRDLTGLGVAPNSLVMVHASLRAMGPVIGGVNTVIDALFHAIGPAGTLFAYVDFEPFFEDDDDPEAIPVFDPRTARAARDHGILHEALRTWPGTLRSGHPDAGVIANGPLAEWLITPHPFQYGYGEGTPFARFVERQGKVLMLGAPLDTITLLHHAEHLAQIPGKRIVRYRRRMPAADGPRWVEFEEFDTSEPVSAALPADCFERIARDFLAAGHGRQGRVGNADTFLFDGPALVAFAIAWLERSAGRS